LSLTIVALAVCLFFLQNPVSAVGSLTVTAQKGLSLVTESETLTIQGFGVPSSSQTTIVIHLSGPANISQLSETSPLLASAGTVTYTVDPAADMSPDGSFQGRIVIPSGTLPAPGAYLAEVEVVGGTVIQATGSLWFGKVAVPPDNVDVACVWPLTLGVHRDMDGVFFDRVLEDAVAGADGASDEVAGLTALAGKFPNWKFTLAVEPIVLSQLRDMADGYARFDDAGVRQEVRADEEPAKNAAAALSALKYLAASEKREVAVTPYAGPSMEVLANKGWRDGLQQLQLGKQVTQQILGLTGTVSGAYASDLDITTDSLASYGQASIDHVVVSSSVAADLVESTPAGTVTARVRDKNNQRVTLVFADEQMQGLMSPPWDIGLFYAGLAAELASGSRSAFVITPAPGATIPPAAYLQAVGYALQQFSWMRTITVTGLVRVHSPGSRPVLLDRSSPASPGYIAQGMQAGVEAAHQAVEDIAEAAGPGRQLIENAQALLYTAESRWWSLPDTSPKVASIGLLYAERARALAEAELAKVTTGGFRSTSVNGRGGTVGLLVDNAATYPVKAEVLLEPEGLTLPDGKILQVEVQPGRTEIPIRVAKTKGTPHLRATLAAGTHTLGTTAHSVRFVTVVVFLPWAVGALVVIVIAAATVLTVRRRRSRKKRTRA
jgi:hypothetical protein